jgi:iron complex outermembrane receptor protein
VFDNLASAEEAATENLSEENTISENEPNSAEDEEFFEMSIEQLMKMEVGSSATLTQSEPRLVPAAVTTITEEQIRASGARSLFELLDIYVPNLQWMRHHWEADVMGLRGIIADRDDKYLLLVNGRNMNQRTHFGALSEQDLVLLQDIHHIDIVRGPGSALYGPGAVSMVINIVTHTYETFEGTEFTTRVGVIEEFYTGELKHGQKIDEDGGFFLYAGIGQYNGTSKYDAPHIYPFTFPSTGGSAPDGVIPWDGSEAGKPMKNAPIGNDGGAALDMPPTKVHLEINRGNWDFWTRYTRGGKYFSLATGSLARDPYGWADWAWYSKYGALRQQYPNFYAYQQLTGYLGYKQEISDKLEIDYGISYDTLTYVKERETRPVDDYREDEYYGKALLRWNPNDRHKIAFGFEYSHLDLGLGSWDGLGYSHPELCGSTVVEYPHSQAWGYNVQMPRWSTNMFSYFGEHQWNINDRWTTFVGARLDDHTYTDLMFSPRAAIVHTPNDRDTLKLMWSRSVRSNFEEELKRQAMDPNNSSNSDPEVLDAVELRFERQQNEHLDLASSIFLHYNLEVITYNNSLEKSVLVGTQREYGIELEASYHTKTTRVIVSHGYTKLYDFDLEPGQTTYITSEPYGYGDDLTNWANHITKLTAQHNLNDQWTLDASLRIYWGFPGRKDYDQYYPYAGDGRPSIIEYGWERAYRGNYYLNLGLQYKPQKNLTFGIVGYNLLGVFNKDLNKRNYMDVVGSGDYRSHAPAVGLSMMYKF